MANKRILNNNKHSKRGRWGEAANAPCIVNLNSSIKSNLSNLTDSTATCTALDDSPKAPRQFKKEADLRDQLLYIKLKHCH
jgi:hypothetical protein